MTNTEIIQAVRNEIEQMKSIEYPCDNSEQATGFCDALDRMTDFLSTLESEKPINLDDAMKELDEKIALVKERGTWDGVDVDKYMDEVRGREPEKPINQDELEKEINRYLEPIHTADIQFEPFTQMTKCARHFAEWGYLRAAEKYNEIEYNRQRAEESVPNDLEEAARDYAWDDYGIIYEGERVNGYIIDHVKDAFIAGAKWQAEKDARDMYMSDNRHYEKVYQLGKKDMKEQMMKEAVEGTVMDFSSNQPRPQVDVLLDPHKYHTGDKVRIIIVKE